jgi:CheY-like chemotaxis protein
MDIVLPDEDGYSFVKKLRMSNDASIRNIPAIALTALVSEEFRERALAEGFQLYLGKPIPAPEIVTHIMNLLGPAGATEFRRTG